MMKTRENQRHKFTTRDDFMKEFNQTKCLRDNKLIVKLINQAVCYLDSRNITEYEDFTSLLKKCNFSTPSITDSVLEFKNFIKRKQDEKEYLEHKIDWISNRSLKKVNLSGKNVIFNRLFIEFPNVFLEFIISYFQNLSGLNLDYLISSLKTKIQLIENQACSTFFQPSQINQTEPQIEQPIEETEQLDLPIENNHINEEDFGLFGLNDIDLNNNDDDEDEFFSEYSDFSIQFEI